MRKQLQEKTPQNAFTVFLPPLLSQRNTHALYLSLSQHKTQAIFFFCVPTSPSSLLFRRLESVFFAINFTSPETPRPNLLESLLGSSKFATTGARIRLQGDVARRQAGEGAV